MNSFSNGGKLQPKKCIGIFSQSEYRASWVLYVKDSPSKKPHFYIEISYMAAKGAKKNAVEAAKKMALEKGYDLIEIFEI